MKLLYILLVLIIIICILSIIYIVYYNKLQYLRTKVEHSEGIIDEVLRERYDYIVRVSDKIKTILKDDKNYFKEYINLKYKDITNFELDRKLKEAINLIFKFRDDYPELKEDNEIKEIIEKFRNSSEKLSASTEYYNKNTNEINGLVRKFPSNIVSKVHGFKIKPFFDGKDMTDEIYNDFKLK